MTARAGSNELSHLQPPSQSLPRLPFSSPISEEVLSPGSPESARGKSIFDRNAGPPPSNVRNPFADFQTQQMFIQLESSAEHKGPAMQSIPTLDEANAPSSVASSVRTGPAMKHARRFSVNKLSRDRSKRRQPKETGRSRRPGLNLITNFSKPPTLAMRIADAISNRSQPSDGAMEDATSKRIASKAQGRPAMQAQHGGFVSLADLKALSSQVPLSNGASGPTKKVVVDSSDVKAPKVDTTASSSREGFSTLRPVRKHHEESDGNEYPEAEAKHDALAGLGFDLKDYSKPSLPRGAQPNSNNGNSLAWTGFTEISPSDRPIVIGISVPSTRLAEYALSPESALSNSKWQNIPTPVTPTIIVTPAKKETSWSLSPKDNNLRSTRRPVSSLYSQWTPYTAAPGEQEDIPPMPSLPADTTYPHMDPKSSHAKSYGLWKLDTSFAEESGLERQHRRRFSTNTFLDDDDEPRIFTRGRSFSGESRQGIMSRRSIDSVATRHRSRGWWNFITSPFLTRSNTIVTIKSPLQSEKRPELPSPARAAALAEEQKQEEFIEKEITPFDTYTPRISSGHTSIWTDMTEWEAQRTRLGAATDRTPRVSMTERQVLHKPQDSSATVPFMMVGETVGGAAGEYHETCQHKFDNNPFHECQCHICSADTQKASRDVSTSSGRAGEIPAYVPTTRGGNNPFFQEPCDRFAAEFGQAAPYRPRANSDSTDIDDDTDISPNVHEAVAAPVVRARIPATARPFPSRQGSQDTHDTSVGLAPSNGPPMNTSLPVSADREMPRKSPPGPPPYSPPRRTTKFPKYVAVMPPDHIPSVRGLPQSPGPVSPGMQQAMSSNGGIPMSEVSLSSRPVAQGQNHIINNYHPNPPAPAHGGPVTLADLEPPSQMQWRNEARRRKLENEDRVTRKAGGLWRGRGCVSNRGCCGRRGAEGRRRRRWYFGLAAALVAMIILIVVLAMTLTRKGNNTAVQSQWLNVTGYPPIPTGVSTIARPDVVDENSGCVQPATLWSCALPKEQHQSVIPNDPDQPNFRVEIRFYNGSIPTNPNSTSTGSSSKHKRFQSVVAGSVSAREFIRKNALLSRGVVTDGRYSPSPDPPNLEDQRFLGNATDDNTAPFEGESTPFFISFLSPDRITTSSLRKRQAQTGTNATDTFPDLGKAIPPPDVNKDGTAAPSNLSPLPSSQPLRIFNRGLSTEHYGFYSYFDRSIFLKATALVNSSATNSADVPDNQNGGSTENGASVRCTWAQTRFLVQIWTNQGNSSSLLSGSNSTGTTTSPSPSSSSKATSTTPAISASNFDRPGSFPYPITITLDRHGGDISKKSIYCYGMDDRQNIVTSQKKLQLENRGFGGILINPAQGPFGHVNVSAAEGGPGGIDGGTGGCACQWRNFQPKH